MFSLSMICYFVNLFGVKLIQPKNMLAAGTFTASRNKIVAPHSENVDSRVPFYLVSQCFTTSCAIYDMYHIDS